MEACELQKFRHLLDRLEQELKAQLAENEQGQTVELDQSRMGRLSRMDALQDQQVALEQKRRLEGRLVAVEGALRRVDNGSFGYCFICGEPLSPKRLEFDPTITRCMQCLEE